VEQPTSTYFPGVPPVTEDTLVLLRTAAPSDCLLFVRLINLHLHFTLHVGTDLCLRIALSRTPAYNAILQIRAKVKVNVDLYSALS